MKTEICSTTTASAKKSPSSPQINHHRENFKIEQDALQKSSKEPTKKNIRTENSKLKTSSLDRHFRPSLEKFWAWRDSKRQPNLKKRKSKKRWLIAEIRRLKKCQSKYSLMKFLIKMSGISRKLLRYYLTDCFIIDVCSRRLENKKFLISKRNLFLRILSQPEMLRDDCHFDNNILKNFCTGASNFLQTHLGKILESFVLYH